MNNLTQTHPLQLQAHLQRVVGSYVKSIDVSLQEVTITVQTQHYLQVLELLKNSPALQFEQLVDLCGVDYSAHQNLETVFGFEDKRFAVVLHLLSVSLNQRVRVRAFVLDDASPVLPSVTKLWSSADWYEREAFDLFGIVFDGHEDLRRILTDYGFVGHPFRKDFPMLGHVQMRYDEQSARVVYEPVTVELREITPRIVREDGYGRGVKG